MELVETPLTDSEFGIGLAETSLQYRSIKYFADILDQRTGSKLKVQIFPRFVSTCWPMPSSVLTNQ